MEAYTPRILNRSGRESSIKKVWFYHFHSAGSSSPSGCRKAYLEIQLVESKLHQQKNLYKVELS